VAERRLPIRCPEHVATPGKEWWQQPECGWFLAQPWHRTYGTQNGTIHEWGGICKRHGEVRDGT